MYHSMNYKEIQAVSGRMSTSVQLVMTKVIHVITVMT